MCPTGDGSPSVVGPIVTHAFPAVYNPDETIDWTATAKDYTVTLTVTDDNDPALTDTDTCIVHITPPPYPPVADPNGPYTAYPWNTVTLDGSASYDPNGALYPDPSHPWHGYIVSWEWDLDNDGEYDDAIGETTTWSNCELGLYVVGLKVTNSFDESDEADTVINVVEQPPGVEVAIDIRPQSCPNPIYTGIKGVLPVAILGTVDLDVTQIDPATVRLSDVAPLRWSLRDKSTPFEPFIGKEDCEDCNKLGPDGYLDLTLKFDSLEVVAALGDVNDRDCIVLTLTGSLKEEFGGTPIFGEDVVVILKKR
jgi:hypothetical protein